jgi:hypothetical protein
MISQYICTTQYKHMSTVLVLCRTEEFDCSFEDLQTRFRLFVLFSVPVLDGLLVCINAKVVDQVI